MRPFSPGVRWGIEFEGNQKCYMILTYGDNNKIMWAPCTAISGTPWSDHGVRGGWREFRDSVTLPNTQTAGDSQITRHRAPGLFCTHDRPGGGVESVPPCYLENQWSYRAQQGGVRKLSTRSFLISFEFNPHPTPGEKGLN